MHSGKPNVEVARRQARRWQELSLILTFLWVAFCSGLSFASRADRGGDDARVASGRGGIEGVVGETRRVAGRDYAIVSVGTDDGVRRDMRLAILNPRGELLGSLTVTNVDPEESIGVLSGPRVNEIRPNDRVTTDPAGKDDGGREQV
jgi:hypothetical protein